MSDLVRVQQLVAMSYEEFEQQSDKHLLPLRNLEEKNAENADDYERRWSTELSAWPERWAVDASGKSVPRKQRPENYWGWRENAVTSRSSRVVDNFDVKITEFDGSPLRKPTRLYHSPQSPGMAKPQQRYESGSEHGAVRADWQRGINGW